MKSTGEISIAPLRGISGVLDTARAEKGPPQEPQHSARRGGGTDWPRSGRSVWSRKATCVALMSFAVQLLSSTHVLVVPR